MQNRKELMRKFLPPIAIIFAAVLWGIIAIFVNGLAASGFSSMQMVGIRVISAFTFLLLYGLLFNRQKLKIRLGHFYYFIGTGIFSIIFFNWCYFYAIQELSVSLAVILLYTSPAFVTIMSILFLGEKFTKKKIVAVIGTILGCILIAGVSRNGPMETSFSGILIGLGAGFGYALYSIFGKVALKSYHPFTLTFYTFFVAALCIIPVTKLWTIADKFDITVILYGIGFGLFPTVLAFLLYSWGLNRVESSKAAVLATVEPVIAFLVSVFLFNESFTAIQFIGSFIIILSCIYMNYQKRERMSNDNLPQTTNL